MDWFLALLLSQNGVTVLRLCTGSLDRGITDDISVDQWVDKKGNILTGNIPIYP